MTATPCDRCGKVHERCGAHRKRRGADGELVPCGQRPIDGTEPPRCRMHAGVTADQAMAKVQKRLALGRAMGEAGRLLEELGGVRVEAADPLRTLSMAVAVAAAMVEVFTDLVAGLNLEGVTVVVDDEDGSARIITDPRAMVGPTHLGDLGVHPFVELLGSWTERAARVSKAALDAGVSERQMQLAERDVRQLAAGYRAFVVGLVDALVAAGVERELLDRVVATQAPSLMRKALMSAGIEEAS